MDILSDSHFSCRMLTRAMEDRWCDQLVANCVPNLDTKVSKQSMEVGGSLVNQLKAPPFSEVGNTQHRTTMSKVYKLMWIVYTSICSSGWSFRRNGLCSCPSTWVAIVLPSGSQWMGVFGIYPTCRTWETICSSRTRPQPPGYEWALAPR